MLQRSARWLLPLLCVLVVQPGQTKSIAGSGTCQALHNEYLEFNRKEAVPFTGKNMVYFLHIPRTAGRTFHSCLLKLATPPSRRCPRAYDHLRINFTLPNCFLLSSHDDFSVVENLPPETAVVSQLRDPVDRFISAYEFAIEVSIRHLSPRRPPRRRPRRGVVTDDVWPWSHLIPFFAEDMRQRRANLKDKPPAIDGDWRAGLDRTGADTYINVHTNATKAELSAEEMQRVLPPLDAYNNPLVMPLEEFVEHPVAREMLHNGQLFQVLGVTNYSHWPHAEELRDCAWADPALEAELLKFAKRRVQRFTHVGTTDRLTEAVEAAAATLQTPLDGPAWAAGEANVSRAGSRRFGRQPQAHAGEGDDDSEHHSDDEYDEEEEGEPADLHKLAATVRQTRQRLQAAQDKFNKAAAARGRPLRHRRRAHSGEPALQEVRKELNTARQELRQTQDVLLDARVDAQTRNEGRALQDSGDPQLQQNLGNEYMRCSTRAQARNLRRRDNSLRQVAMPDGRHLSFSREARKSIPWEVIQAIKAKNQADRELYLLGTQMLDVARELHSSSGALQTLPPAVKGAHRRAGRRPSGMQDSVRDEL